MLLNFDCIKGIEKKIQFQEIIEKKFNSIDKIGKKINSIRNKKLIPHKKAKKIKFHRRK